MCLFGMRTMVIDEEFRMRSLVGLKGLGNERHDLPPRARTHPVLELVPGPPHPSSLLHHLLHSFLPLPHLLPITVQVHLLLLLVPSRHTAAAASRTDTHPRALKSPAAPPRATPSPSSCTRGSRPPTALLLLLPVVCVCVRVCHGIMTEKV